MKNCVSLRSLGSPANHYFGLYTGICLSGQGVRAFYTELNTERIKVINLSCLFTRHGSSMSRHNHLIPRLFTHCGARRIRPDNSSNLPPTLIATKGFENLGFGIWDLRFAVKYSCFGAPRPMNNNFVSLF